VIPASNCHRYIHRPQLRRRSVCDGVILAWINDAEKERLGTNSSLNEQRLISAHHRLNALRSQNTLRGVYWLFARARAPTPPLSLYNVIHACAAAFFSFSLALALRTRASSSSLLCESSSPAGRARSHPTFSA
jgi:hypothetical protein